MRVILHLAAAFGIASDAAYADACRTDQPEFAVEFGDFVSWERRFTPGQQRSLPADGARYVRVLFRQRDEADAAWTLRIRDGEGRPLQSISSSATGTEPFWTRRLYADDVDIVVESEATLAPVASLFYQKVLKSVVPFYSIKGNIPDWSDVYDRDADAGGLVEGFWKRGSESVGLFVATAGNNLDGVAVWTCSGVLVADSPDLLFLTNDHCGGIAGSGWPASVCESNGFVDFSWDGDQVSRQHDCREVVARSPESDLALLRLAPSASDAPPVPATFATDVIADEPLAIIHHPAGDTKKISRGCAALTSDLTGTLNESNDFAYDCDTESGSSGAPVFNAAGFLVGIHHTGHEKMLDGRCDQLNKAVRVGRIREFLSAEGLAP